MISFLKLKPDEKNIELTFIDDLLEIRLINDSATSRGTVGEKRKKIINAKRMNASKRPPHYVNANVATQSKIIRVEKVQ